MRPSGLGLPPMVDHQFLQQSPLRVSGSARSHKHASTSCRHGVHALSVNHAARGARNVTRWARQQSAMTRPNQLPVRGTGGWGENATESCQEKNVLFAGNK